MKLRKGGFLLSKVHQLQGRIFAALLKEHRITDLNPAQGRILFALWQEDGLPINEVAKRTALKKTTMTSMLERLERSGYISVLPSEDDRRKSLVYLTPKCGELRGLYEQVSQQMTAIYYAGLDEKEIDEFERVLQVVFDNLTRHEASKFH